LLGRGAAILLALPIAGALARSAAADPISDGDLAYARLLVGSEVLAADFYARALAAKRFKGAEVRSLRRALFNEKEHYAAMARILTDAGQVPAVAADFDFLYPKGGFASRAAIAKLGVKLETLALSAYLGAVDGLEASSLKQPAARIAASEAQHLSVLTGLAGGNPIGSSFPSPLTIDEASNALDAFMS
jgi:hypothetical protein